jgi:hypothetical protein
MYRKRNRFSRKLEAMRAGRERKRLEGEAPDYPLELPELRREIIVITMTSGASNIASSCAARIGWIAMRCGPTASSGGGGPAGRACLRSCERVSFA